MNVRFTARALEDLDDVFDFISKDSAAFASKTIGELMGVARTLTKFPYLGRLYMRPDGVQYRVKVHRNYRIAYQIMSDRIEILSIQHIARDRAD